MAQLVASMSVAALGGLPRSWVRISLEAKIASMSVVVLGGVAKVVGSNLARGKIISASMGSVDLLYPQF